jgi:hypothetical protein
MARKGAQHRYEELKAEIATLVKRFPHLAARASSDLSQVVSKGRRALGAAVKTIVRKRRRMSAEARQKIREAQLKRWAKIKAGAKK